MYLDTTEVHTDVNNWTSLLSTISKITEEVLVIR